MSDGYTISRGNPRSSSVGEEEDVEQVRYRSTTAIDPSSIVDIVLCGSQGDPCADLDLSLYNIMGQEDKNREANGIRVDNGGKARIVFTAAQDVVIEKIEYERAPKVQPGDQGGPTLTQEWNPNPPATDKHEVFVSVSPDATYAFRVTVSVDGCPDTNTSGIYYFTTGDQIIIEPADNIEVLVETSIIEVDISVELLADDIESIEDSSESIDSLDTNINTEQFNSEYTVDSQLPISETESDEFVTLTSNQVV